MTTPAHTKPQHETNDLRVSYLTVGRCPNCGEVTNGYHTLARRVRLWSNQHGTANRIYCERCGLVAVVTTVDNDPRGLLRSIKIEKRGCRITSPTDLNPPDLYDLMAWRRSLQCAVDELNDREESDHAENITSVGPLAYDEMRQPYYDAIASLSRLMETLAPF